MENYYKQKAEVKIIKERLNSKVEEKDWIYIKYFGGTKDYSEGRRNNTTNPDLMTRYLIELEEKGIPEEIRNLRQEFKIKEKYLKNMEEILANLEGLEYDFIKLRYFEKHEYTLEEIAIKLRYSIEYIRRVSSRIEKKLEKLRRLI